MNSSYPAYVPKPGTDGSEPKDKVLVTNPDYHKKVNPEHYQRSLEHSKPRPNAAAAVIAQGVAEERERCARIAESIQRGNKLGLKIAEQIRSGIGSAKGIAQPEPDPAVPPTENEPQPESEEAGPNEPDPNNA